MLADAIITLKVDFRATGVYTQLRASSSQIVSPLYLPFFDAKWLMVRPIRTSERIVAVPGPIFAIKGGCYLSRRPIVPASLRRRRVNSLPRGTRKNPALIASRYIVVLTLMFR